MLLAAFSHLIQFSGVLRFPKGDIQNTTVLGTGIPKTRGYPKHCNRASEGKLEREAGAVQQIYPTGIVV